MIETGVTAACEIKDEQQVYGIQIVATKAQLLRERFRSPHTIGKAIKLSPISSKSLSIIQTK